MKLAFSQSAVNAGWTSAETLTIEPQNGNFKHWWYVEDPASRNQGFPSSKLNEVRISMTWKVDQKVWRFSGLFGHRQSACLLLALSNYHKRWCTREKEPVSPHKCQGRAAWIGGEPVCFCEKSSAPVIAGKKNLITLFDVDSSILPF